MKQNNYLLLSSSSILLDKEIEKIIKEKNFEEASIITYDLEEVPDSVIKAVIGNLNKDDAMLSVLFNCYHLLLIENIK